MSIILDALKKAQQERVQSGEKQKSQASNLVIATQKKSLPPVIIIPIIIVCLAVFSVLIYVQFIKKPGPTISPKPITSSPQTVQTEKEDPATMHKEALKLFAEGNFEGSRKIWEKLTLLTPSNAEVHNNLGVVLKKLGDKKAADKAYQQALEQNPDYPEALNNLGSLLMEDNKEKEAIPLFTKAVKIKPDYAEPHFHLGLIMEKGGYSGKAYQHYKRFLELSPDIPVSLRGQIEMRIISLKPSL